MIFQIQKPILEMVMILNSIWFHYETALQASSIAQFRTGGFICKNRS